MSVISELADRLFMSTDLPNAAVVPTPVPELVDFSRRRNDPTAPTVIPEDDEAPLSAKEVLTSSAAVSYYMSLGLHLLGYLIAAGLFVLFGHHLLDDTSTVMAIRARLDDQEVLDDNPFEELPNVLLDTVEQPSKLSQISNSIKAVDNGIIETANLKDLSTLGGTDPDVDDAAAQSSFLFRLPEAGLAVTKGSFTAWTSPARPQPREAYRIIIEVRLPDELERYRLSDLSGTVRGTDSFRRSIPLDRRPQFKSTSFYTDEDNKLRPISGGEVVKVRGNRVQLVVLIPGAENEIRDTIKIKSRRLREEQELELVFGEK